MSVNGLLLVMEPHKIQPKPILIHKRCDELNKQKPLHHADHCFVNYVAMASVGYKSDLNSQKFYSWAMLWILWMHGDHIIRRSINMAKTIIQNQVWPRCYITVALQWAPWRLKSPASALFSQLFVQTQIKENIKTLHHWPLREIHRWSSQRASNAENVSIWWRLHYICCHWWHRIFL